MIINDLKQYIFHLFNNAVYAWLVNEMKELKQVYVQWQDMDYDRKQVSDLLRNRFMDSCQEWTLI